MSDEKKEPLVRIDGILWNTPWEMFPGAREAINRVGEVTGKLIDLNSESTLLVVKGEKGEILRFERNGDVFYKGELVENAKDVVDGFRQFLEEREML